MYICIVLGRWKFENWRLYRRRLHHSRGNPKNQWWAWDAWFS